MGAVRLLFGLYVGLGLVLIARRARAVKAATGTTAIVVLRDPRRGEVAGLAGLVGYLAAYFVATFFPGVAAFSPWWPAGPVVLAVAAGLLLASLAGWWASARAMGDAWRIGIDPHGPPAPLVRSGPYARVRHPIYAAMLLGFVGEFVLFPCAFTAVALLLGGAAVVNQALREERFLAARHGSAWDAHRAATGLLWPRRRRPPGAP